MTDDRSRRLAALALGLVLAAAFGARIATTVALPNVVWPDEIFQSLEPAHRAAFGTGVVTWEYRVGARSWVLPGLLAGAMELGSPFGRLGHLRAAQVVLALLSLAPVWAAFAWTRRRHGVAAAVAAAVACATWFELVYFSGKALNEVTGAHALLAGLCLGSGEATPRRLRAAGAALGLAIVLRMHLATSVLVAAPFLAARSWSRWRPILAGGAAVVLAAGLLDLATWGAPFHSFWTNFRFNVVEGRSAAFGVKPWHAYLGWLAGNWSWAAVPVAALGAVGAVRWPAAAGAAVAALATHSAFAHKEYRFLYPFVALAIVLAAIGLGEVAARAAARLRAPRWAAAAALALAWAGASGWAGVRFRSDGAYGFARAGASMWTQGAEGLRMMARAGELPRTCGVAIADVHWAWTGGYTWLHRDVPLLVVGSPRELGERAASFDVIVGSRKVAPSLRGFTIDDCGSELCLATRPGACTPDGAPTINQQLADWGA